MSSGLRGLLKLPPIERSELPDQQAEFCEQFRQRIKVVDGHLQVVAAQAGRSVHQPLDAMRAKLIAAQQKATALVDPRDPRRAAPALQRVIEALDVVEAKASAAASGVAAGRDQWLDREETLDEILRQSEELRDAGHKKAKTLVKLAEVTRARARAGLFQEANTAFDALQSKFSQIAGASSELLDGGPQQEEKARVLKTLGISPTDIPTDIPIEILKTLFGPRDCLCEVVNLTDVPLQFLPNSVKHDWGSFKTFPPDVVQAGASGSFTATNNGPITGTEGELRYRLDEEGTTWLIRWNNPRSGENTLVTKIEGPNAARFEPPVGLVNQEDNANFRFTLKVRGGKPGPGPGPGPGPNVGVDAASSCHVTVANQTEKTLTLGNQGHERGDFMTFPETTLAPGASTTFVSVETPNATDPSDEGCQGFLLWQVGGPDVLWRVEWDNPEGAKNTAQASFNPPNAGYNSLNQIGQGEENVPITFTLSGAGVPSVTPPVGKVAKLPIHVRDEETDQPVPAATVAVAGQRITMNDQGEATAELPVGMHDYVASAKQYRTEGGSVQVIEGDNRQLRIALTPGVDAREGLTVVVRDRASGEPIPDAQATVGDQTDTTSALGLATVELPVGAHRYEVTAESYRKATGNVEIIQGDNPELIVELSKEDECDHASLAVVVVDDETSAPIADASVTVGEKNERTSAAGLSVLTLEPDTYAYEVMHADYPAPATGSVDVAEGDDNELAIRLRKEGPSERATLAVIVVDDETSAPLANATVSVGDQTDQTSAAGLSVLNMAPGEYLYDVAAEDPDYSPETGSVEVAEGNDNELTVRLKKESSGATVTFHVTDKETGEPIPEANIRLGDQPGQTDANGQAQFDVDAGDLRYVVSKEAYGEASGEVEAKADSNVDEYVELEKLDDFVPPSEVNEPTLRKGDESVDGWVEYLQKLLLHHGYEPVPSHGKFDQQTYDAVKQFQKATGCLVDGIVGNETWSALREDPERAPVGVDDRPDEQGPEGRWGTEGGDVIAYFADGDDLLLTVVSVGDQAIDDFKAEVFVDGKRINPITIGPPTDSSATGAGHTHAVRIRKFAATYGPGAHEIDAYLPQELGGDRWTGQSPDHGGGDGGDGGGTTTQSTELATLEVRLVDADDRPFSGAKVRISTGPSTPPDATTDSAGIAKFELLPGEYHVNAAYRAYVFEPVHIKPGDLKPGQTHKVVMSTIITGGLDVTVLFDGAPAAGATVSVSPSVHAAQTTSSNGAALFELAAGKYQITAVSSDGEWSGAGAATIVSDEMTSAIVELVYGKDGRTRTGGL